MDMLRTPKIKSIVVDAATQLRRLLPLLLFVYLPLLLGLAGLVGAYLVADIPLRMFFIDPVAEFNSPMYIGFVSNFGVLLWCSAASVSLFSGLLTLQNTRQKELGWFLLCGGAITAVLMFDDLYLLHEEVIEDHLFIPQKYVFAAYGVMILALLYRFRKIILNTDYVLLVLAFMFFGASVFVDLFITPEEFFIFGSFPGRHIIEDGLKLLGIATWATYFLRMSMNRVAPLIQQRNSA